MMNKTKTITVALLGTLALSSLAPAAFALTAYSQDFESMTPNQGYPPNDLAADGWFIFGIEYDANPYTGPANQTGVYGPFEAANGEPGSIQGVATGQGGPDQGDVVLAKYTDYNNQNQPVAYIQALTYQTQMITGDDLGLWRFSYDAKIGNLFDDAGDSSAFAYVQTLDPTQFFQKVLIANDSTFLPVEWGTYSIDIMVDETMIGDILNFGFSATATNYNGSAVFYDNLNFARVPIPVPPALWLLGFAVLALTGISRKSKRS